MSNRADIFSAIRKFADEHGIVVTDISDLQPPIVVEFGTWGFQYRVPRVEGMFEYLDPHNWGLSALIMKGSRLPPNNAIYHAIFSAHDTTDERLRHFDAR